MAYLYKMPMYKPVVCVQHRWTHSSGHSSTKTLLCPNIFSNYLCPCLVGWNSANESNVFHLVGPKVWVHSTLSCCFVLLLQGVTLQLRLVWKFLLPLLISHRARIDYCNFVVFLHMQSNSLRLNHNSFLLPKTSFVRAQTKLQFRFRTLKVRFWRWSSACLSVVEVTKKKVWKKIEVLLLKCVF